MQSRAVSPVTWAEMTCQLDVFYLKKDELDKYFKYFIFKEPGLPEKKQKTVFKAGTKKIKIGPGHPGPGS